MIWSGHVEQRSLGMFYVSKSVCRMVRKALNETHNRFASSSFSFSLSAAKRLIASPDFSTAQASKLKAHLKALSSLMYDTFAISNEDARIG